MKGDPADDEEEEEASTLILITFLAVTVLFLAVAVAAVRLKRKQGSHEEDAVVDMVGVQPGGHQSQDSNVSNASMYAEEFKTQGHEHGVDMVLDEDYIEQVMNVKAPKVLGYNEYVHPPNEKAANQIYGCKTSGKATKGNSGDLEQPTVEGQ